MEREVFRVELFGGNLLWVNLQVFKYSICKYLEK